MTIFECRLAQPRGAIGRTYRSRSGRAPFLSVLAKHGRSWQDRSVPARRCRVTIGPDQGDGLSHQIDVEASSIYEAAVAGLEALQREPWTPPHVGDLTPIAVTLPDTGVTHTVHVRKIREWVARTAGSPAEVFQRRQLRERLAARGIIL